MNLFFYYYNNDTFYILICFRIHNYALNIRKNKNMKTWNYALYKVEYEDYTWAYPEEWYGKTFWY